MKIYRLKEAKTSQLRKLYLNGNIDEKQFEIADKFFKTYSAFENEIDWNRKNITWDDLKAVIYKERNSESNTKKRIRKGLEGFEEGKDYIVLEETNSYTAYQPFTWEASRMIASHYVEPSRNKKGEIKDARWCTAYQKDSKYWDKHNRIEAFIYICGETIPSKKVAVSIRKEEYDAQDTRFLYSTGNLYFNIWDFDDYNYTIKEDELLEVVPNFYGLIEMAYKHWEDKYKENILSKLKLNPQTNRYDYDGDLDRDALNILFVSEDKDGFTINFGKVTGNFNCSELGLISLKGAPTEVGETFWCSGNELISLKGAPQKVGEGFDCSFNPLTSLKGAPQEVGGDFDCYKSHLTSLKGAPQKVGEDFNCSRNELTSLEGAPQEVGGIFCCYETSLISLEGAPQKVGKDFNCSRNQLTSLEGAPQTVGRSFNCSSNQLTSLKGAPKTIEKGYFNCYNNQLTSLEGAPHIVGGPFDCHNNYLTSLEGAPQTVGWDFYCNINCLTSLKGAPQKVGGGFDCTHNPNLHSLDGIGAVAMWINKDF